MSVQTISLPFDIELLPVRKLSAGDLNCLYEKGNLRYIKWGDTEIVRMIYGAVRDEHWATAPYTIEDEVIHQEKDSFSISYTAIYRLNKIHYKANFEIEGKANTISFSMQGEALSDFQRNRIGICVLHPLSCAGKKVVIYDQDGNKEENVFPQFISPHQPFKNIQQLQWEINDQSIGTLNFEGDIFETEDQRNWTDSSYKTYSTPLELPFPVRAKKGATIEQKVELKVESIITKSSSTAITQSEEKVPFPKIGYSRFPGSRLNEDEIQMLRLLPFNHYRVEIRFRHNDWQQQFADAVSEAKRLGTKIELIVFLADDMEKETAMLLEAFEEDSEQVESILILQQKQLATPSAMLHYLYAKVKKSHPHIQIGYGTDDFFAELNRNRPEGLMYDFVSFSLNPQVHADDTRSLMENLEAQKDTIATLQSFTGDKAIHVSPVTFKIRSQEDGVASSDGMKENGLPPDYDARQHTSFGAWWTLQSIKNLSRADCITFYETIGFKGIIASRSDSTAGTGADGLTPLYKALKRIKEFNPLYVIHDTTTADLLLEDQKGQRLSFILEEQHKKGKD